MPNSDMPSLLPSPIPACSKAGKRRCGRLAAALLPAFLLAALSLPVAAAKAAFPGKNGQIAFSTDRDGDSEIYTMEADGSHQTNRTNDRGQDFFPAFSADGTKIAFERYASRVFTMNADGSGQTRISGGQEPAYAPDGTKIAFYRGTDANFNRDIFTISPDRTGDTDLTNSDANESSPTYSPDGTKIAFASDRDGNLNIYTMNADGSGVAQLTHTPVDDSSPTYSPDGTKLAFSRQVAANPQPPCPPGQTCDIVFQAEIYVMNVDGSGVTQLTDNPAVDKEPAFSPDGTKIAFTRDAEESNPFCSPGRPCPPLLRGEIYVMNVDGSGVTQLTDNPADDSSPDWGPRPVPPAPAPSPPSPPASPPLASNVPLAPAPLGTFAATNTRVTISGRVVRATRGGLVSVNLNNANGFEVNGLLSLGTVRAFATSAAQHSASARRRRNRILGANRFRLAAKHSVLVTIRLSRRNLRLLRHLGQLRVRATATVRDPAGHTRTIKGTFTLKAPATRTRRR